jgi:hypothetical protein
MTRKDVIDQSIQALIGMAQTLSLGAKAIEGIVNAEFVDGQVMVLANDILGSLQEMHQDIESGIKDFQFKALYDFPGMSSDLNCPECSHEMFEMDEDRYICLYCGFE